ncbi:DNA-binding transcriptional activator of the SARP family [Kaistia soli DSM 19436]|uniref:DNA-binding transcriptional activator of the SARP family n=1 Tax=Kaistia soli DSM 19436 TaxID=1122133 RepID=A0A1M5I6M8_9HYPH|nr:BTAD domain-containing putative transcriptional regulator [Kaistia soli]SHG24008.1 DNA-binding transcriptional activator of the SARP family [Kaistia soli DSM 19436]
MVQLVIHLLGRFAVRVGGEEVPPIAWKRDRAAAIVKLLAISPQHRIHREQIMEAFWPDQDAELAGANLRKAIHFARRAMGAHDLIAVNKEIVAFADEVDLVTDLERFEAAAKRALRSGDPAECEAAADLNSGVLLPDDRFLEWLDAPRERLQQLNRSVLRTGRLWHRLIALDPTDEEAQRALMQAALDAGNRGEAIRQFDQLRERLHAELGVGPSKASIELYERALALSGVEPALPAERIRASIAWALVHLQSGEFDKAAELARETRAQAFDSGLAREVGEAGAVLGLTAHMQGRWPQLFRSEFTEWVRSRDDFVPSVFDGHLCLAEFCLCDAKGHAAIAASARELMCVAEEADSIAGRALAGLILGEIARCAGDLDAAEKHLTEAERLHVGANALSGRVLVLERLAEIALARGQKWQAGRLIQRALGDAAQSWLSNHLLLRLQALAVRAATTPEKVEEAILTGDRLLTPGACQPCSMALRIASTVALTQAGKLEQVDRRLNEAERIAGMWQGGPWAAALWEARGLQRQAQANPVRALAAFAEAAARYEELGRPLDQARCNGRMSDVMPEHAPR